MLQYFEDMLECNEKLYHEFRPRKLQNRCILSKNPVLQYIGTISCICILINRQFYEEVTINYIMRSWWMHTAAYPKLNSFVGYFLLYAVGFCSSPEVSKPCLRSKVFTENQRTELQLSSSNLGHDYRWIDIDILNKFVTSFFLAVKLNKFKKH